MVEVRPMPIIAVMTSIKSAASKGAAERIAPPAAGDKNIMKEDKVLLSPFILMRCSLGTSCGKMAFTAGVWIPVPADRMISTANRNQMFLCPDRKARASKSVEHAMAPSESMIKNFLS